jgi:hypothetical protein
MRSSLERIQSDPNGIPSPSRRAKKPNSQRPRRIDYYQKPKPFFTRTTGNLGTQISDNVDRTLTDSSSIIR